MMRANWVWLMCLAVSLGQPGWSAAAASGGDLEELQYRLSLGIFTDVAQVHLSLSQTEPGRYRAEFAGAAQGAWGLLSRWLPERYETVMILENGRLKPLVFLEEFQSKGQHIHKEYRFDYPRGRLDLWRGVDYREPVKEWQVPLQGPVYDPLSLFYNLRLGALGPLAAGDTLIVALVPIPEPREMIVRIGPESSDGRKVMLEVVENGRQDEAEPYFLFCTSQWVPQQAWIRVPFFGKLTGHLLNPEEIRKGGPLDLPGHYSARRSEINNCSSPLNGGPGNNPRLPPKD